MPVYAHHISGALRRSAAASRVTSSLETTWKAGSRFRRACCRASLKEGGKRTTAINALERNAKHRAPALRHALPRCTRALRLSSRRRASPSLKHTRRGLRAGVCRCDLALRVCRFAARVSVRVAVRSRRSSVLLQRRQALISLIATSNFRACAAGNRRQSKRHLQQRKMLGCAGWFELYGLAAPAACPRTLPRARRGTGLLAAAACCAQRRRGMVAGDASRAPLRRQTTCGDGRLRAAAARRLAAACLCACARLVV